MNNVTAAGKLAEHKWKLFTSQDEGLLPDGRLERYIDGISHRDVDDLVGFLESFVSVPNYEADASIKYAYCTGPLIDSQPKAGKWRHLGVRTQRVDAQGREDPKGSTWRIIQVLAEGFLTTIAHADARLIQGRSNTGDVVIVDEAPVGDNPGAEYLTLEWVGVDPDTVKALADGKLSTATLSGLAYRKIANDGAAVTVALGDGWHCLAVNWELAQDGSGTIRLGVAKPEFVLKGFTSWLGSRQSGLTQYFDVPEALAQGIMDEAKARGADCRANGYDAAQGLVNLTVSQLDLSGVALNDIPISSNCDMVVTASFLWGTGDSSLLPIPGSIPAGTSYDRNLNEDGDGRFSIVLRKNVRQYRNTIPEYDSEFRADQGKKTKVWKGVTDQDLSVDLGAVTGSVVRVRETVREDCSKDVYRDVITPKPQTVEHLSESRADQSTSRTVAKNADAKLEATAQTGKVVRTRSDENEFGKFDNSMDVITPGTKWDTDWFIAGSNDYGIIYKRLAGQLTEAEAEAIADNGDAGVAEVDLSGHHVIGSVSPRDAFGLYAVSCVATPKRFSGFSSTPADPYQDYNEPTTVKKDQYRTIEDGTTEKRTLTLTLRFVGNTSASAVAADLLNHSGVRINPNSTGTYFQGQGYVFDGQSDWAADEDGTL